MDDQNQSGRDNQANIDSLVKELSRPQNVPPGGNQPPRSGYQSDIKSNRPDPLSGSGSGRSSTQPIQRQGIPSPGGNLNPPSLQPKTDINRPNAPHAPKEYQSSIRTMDGDLENIRSGQKTSGIDIPRKIEPDKSQNLPNTGGRVGPPPMPSRDNSPMPKISFGEAQKTRPITPSRPSPELRSPSGFSMPSLGEKSKDDEKSFGAESGKEEFSIPSQPSSPSSLKILSIVLVAVLVILGLAYWFFILRTPGEEIVQSPAPTVSQTPVALSLDDIFSTSAGTINLSFNGDPKDDFYAGLDQIIVGGGDVKKVRVENATENGGSVPLDTLSLLGRFLASYPSELNSVLGGDSVVLVYGQKEVFDATGQLVLNSQNEKRLALVTNITDSSSASQGLSAWENSIPDGLLNLFAIDKNKNRGEFMTNNYRGNIIRYKNFSYPDKSIDYSLVATRSGKVYWLVTNSRESMFEIIDRLSVTNL